MKKEKIVKGWAVFCKGYKRPYFLYAFDNKQEAESETILRGEEVCLKGNAFELHKPIRCEIIIKTPSEIRARTKVCQADRRGVKLKTFGRKS